jgi:hypothetical protein
MAKDFCVLLRFEAQCREKRVTRGVPESEQLLERIEARMVEQRSRK